MARDKYGKIIKLVRKAAELAKSAGIDNLLQPGLVKEMIIADILGHELVPSKRREDACDPHDPDIKYEYLSCKKGGTCQMASMYPTPDEKRAQSLERITRNSKFYFAIFDREDQTKCKVIYEVDMQCVKQEATHKMDQSSAATPHVGFSERWAQRHGRVVYQIDPSDRTDR